ncbi:uncharacterized protein LOC142550028 [Primulina tabacum]|uniref:uncharacterized protein LOC142550028 n=1 Tax=Primulina tabacum TaxID=48773 RepID=UPI003F5AC2DB
MSFRVTPSKVGASVKQNGTVQQLQTMVQSLQQQMQQNQLEMQEMRSMFLQSMNQQNQQEQVAIGGICSGIGNEVSSNGDIDIGVKKNGNFDNVSQSNLRNVNLGDIRANTKCKLLHWCADELVVAEGRIASTNPNTKMHHFVLGRSCSKVWVDKVLVEKVDLIRPNDEMQFLEDAIGNTINPGHYVALLLTTTLYPSTSAAAGNKSSTKNNNTPLRVTRIKLLRPTDIKFDKYR